MLSELVLGRNVQADALVTAEGTFAWCHLRRLTQDLIPQVLPFKDRRVAVNCVPLAHTFAVLAALDAVGAAAVLADTELIAHAALPDVAAVIEPTNLRITPRDAAAAPGERFSGVVVLTSGTTGAPKEVRHTWDLLASGVRPHAATGARWACGYALRLIGSLQVLLQAWMDDGVFIAARSGTSEDTAVFWAASGATCASATPSFWRRLLLRGDRSLLARMPLVQITLGGEIADQPLLDALHLAFPRARLTHIYATTELGRCLAVSDGRAGFPAGWLHQTADRRWALRIENEELLVRRDDGTERAWIPTGDLVRVEGDRVHFAGRRDERINVGGQKVSPLQVEEALRQVVGVADVRVYGTRASLVGQLVACDLVVAAGCDAQTVRNHVMAYAQRHLSPAQQPRFVHLVESIDLTTTGKTKRIMES